MSTIQFNYSFSKENLLDMDFSAYLASSSEEEEEEEEEQAGVVGRGNGEVVSEEEQIQKYRVSLCGQVDVSL